MIQKSWIIMNSNVPWRFNPRFNSWEYKCEDCGYFVPPHMISDEVCWGCIDLRNRRIAQRIAYTNSFPENALERLFRTSYEEVMKSK